jgi:glycopeptide antibiotics resistance protein
MEMFAIARIPDALLRRYMAYATAGFVPLSIGYLLREFVDASNPLVALLLGVFPNLLGSFATPFALMVFLPTRLPALKTMQPLVLFGLINLFTFAVVLLIEYLHIVFDLGVWDANDITASVIGGLAALAAFLRTKRA